MKIGGVGQNSHIGLFDRRGTRQLAKLAPNPGNVRDHLNQAGHGDRPRIDNGTNAGRLHPGSGATKEFGVRMPRAQGLDYARGVQVARSFPGGDEDAHLLVSVRPGPAENEC